MDIEFGLIFTQIIAFLIMLWLETSFKSVGRAAK